LVPPVPISFSLLGGTHLIHLLKNRTKLIPYVTKCSNVRPSGCWSWSPRSTTRTSPMVRMRQRQRRSRAVACVCCQYTSAPAPRTDFHSGSDQVSGSGSPSSTWRRLIPERYGLTGGALSSKSRKPASSLNPNARYPCHVKSKLANVVGASSGGAGETCDARPRIWSAAEVTAEKSATI
jgi:hypothetical protein